MYVCGGGSGSERDLKDKVIVVTGGAEGIGYEMAEKYIAEGTKMCIILDVNETTGAKALQKLCQKFGEGKAIFMKCDVTEDLEAVSKCIFDSYEQVDVLMSNAGAVNENSPPRKTIELNVIPLMDWSMKFFERMRKDKGGPGGTIINVGSFYSYAVDPYLVFYKTSKFAVMGFSRTLGHKDNHKLFGVRIVVFCPGFTKTTLTSKTLCWDQQVSAFNEYLKKQAWQEADVCGVSGVEMFKKAESGSPWKIVRGVLSEVPLVWEGDKQR